MDKRRGLLNIGTSISSRILLLLVALYIRRLLIISVGNEANGINALYGSVLGLLSVAELGVGSAIVFSMYSPIVEGDKRKVAALYCLYRKLYRIIGAIIFAAGLAVMPFLPRLMSDYNTLDINVYTTFFLTLISVVLSYLYGAKTSLIEAHKDNYITTGIATLSRLIRYALQIATLLIFRSFEIFLICQIIETVFVWGITDRVVKKLHPDIIAVRESLDSETSAEVTRNIKAMFMHKAGGILVGAVDGMVISAFIGVAVLGRYSNYTAVAAAATSIISLFFTPLTSVLGHLCASESETEIEKNFEHFYSLNFILGVTFFLGYFAVIDSVISILFGNDLLMPEVVSFVIALNSFTGYMRYSQLTFRDASGTFYYDRWKPVAEGLLNLVLSIALVKVLPPEYAVTGVIAATIITTIVICDIVEPHILFKYVFKRSAKTFYIKNYSNILIFAVALVVIGKIRLSLSNTIVDIFANGCISLAVTAVTLLITGTIDKSFASECQIIVSQAKEWLSKKGKEGSK